MEVKINEINEIKQSGYINWWEFSPQSDLLVIRVKPIDETKLESSTGIILATKASNVVDRPYYGEVVSKGPKCEGNVEVGNIVYFPPNNAFDLAMVHPDEDGSTYLMTTEDRIDGIKVKDIRVS